MTAGKNQTKETSCHHKYIGLGRNNNIKGEVNSHLFAWPGRGKTAVTYVWKPPTDRKIVKRGMVS